MPTGAELRRRSVIARQIIDEIIQRSLSTAKAIETPEEFDDFAKDLRNVLWLYEKNGADSEPTQETDAIDGGGL